MLEHVSIGEAVSFDPSTSKPNGIVNSVQWKLGTDTTAIVSSLEKLQYKFLKAGTYPISLTIFISSTTSCNSATVTKKIQVNDPPKLAWNIPAEIALGDQLVLDASKSYDTDGLISSFDWLIDGKKSGTTPIVSIASLSAGMHHIALTITDNSGTTTQSVAREMDVRVNSKPNPSFVLPDMVYENELLTLAPAQTKDADGDPLLFIWKVDEKQLQTDSIRLAAGRHVITLTANDGRNMKNSIDSVQRELFVEGKPNLDIPYPSNWIAATEINANVLFNSSIVNFLIDGKIQSTWKPAQAGKQVSTIAWTPKGIAIAQKEFAVTVFDSLRFTSLPAEQTITWNPSNPTIVLTVPPVNRAEKAKVNYEWRKGKTPIGVGKVVEAPLTKGRNVFTVWATDQGVEGAHSIFVEIVVVCE